MYEFYGIYAACRDAAWRCQLDFDICSLPVKLSAAAKRAGIRVVRNSVVGELRGDESGASIYCDHKWYIVYDDTQELAQSRIVLAHELGHILLGHEYKYCEKRFSVQGKKLKSEREADMFAIRLLAPACVLHELGVIDPEGIAHLCEIPQSTAAERSRRMKVLEERGKFYHSDLEREVMNRFSDFIIENKLSRDFSDRIE